MYSLHTAGCACQWCASVNEGTSAASGIVHAKPHVMFGLCPRLQLSVQHVLSITAHASRGNTVPGSPIPYLYRCMMCLMFASMQTSQRPGSSWSHLYLAKVDEREQLSSKAMQRGNLQILVHKG
jgi:hypothetical protein